jgi:hypothetical protein
VPSTKTKITVILLAAIIILIVATPIVRHFLLATSTSPAQLSIPDPIALDAQTNVLSGVIFTIHGTFGPTSIFALNARGTVDLSSGTYHANAAGIITGPATTNTGNHPGEVCLNSTGTPPGDPSPYGCLLLGNAVLGFHPVFPTDASTGLGSSTPPTDLTIREPLSAIFGSSVTLHDGDILELRINDDTLVADNAGTFQLSTPAP